MVPTFKVGLDDKFQLELKSRILAMWLVDKQGVG